MARPVDPQRRVEILQSAIKYFSKHGLGNVSMRTLAKSLNVTAPTLLYYFGSKENLIIEVLDAVEAEELAAVDDDSGDLASKMNRYWKERTTKSDLDRFRLQLEAVCLSAAHDALPAQVRSRICTRWINAIKRELEDMGVAKQEAESYATLLHAVQAGLLSDLLATGSRERVDRAQETLMKLITEVLPSSTDSRNYPASRTSRQRLPADHVS